MKSRGSRRWKASWDVRDRRSKPAAKAHALMSEGEAGALDESRERGLEEARGDARPQPLDMTKDVRGSGSTVSLPQPNGAGGTQPRRRNRINGSEASCTGDPGRHGRGWTPRRLSGETTPARTGASPREADTRRWCARAGRSQVSGLTVGTVQRERRDMRGSPLWKQGGESAGLRGSPASK